MTELPVVGGGAPAARALGPLLLVAHSVPALARAIELDLRRRYSPEGFEVRCVDSAEAALGLLRRAVQEGGEPALLVVEQGLADVPGTELIGQARGLVADLRTILTVPYAQMNEALDAMNAGRLDYFFVEPLGEPGKQLHPIVSERLDDWRSWREDSERAVRVVGRSGSPETHAACDFLGRNDIHYRLLDPDTDAPARALLGDPDQTTDETPLPLVVLAEGARLKRPSALELAEGLGLPTRPQRARYDLLVVGGGPAGLAAAVYGASEGLETLLVESYAPGGQAGQSSKIENYLGFPAGIRGGDLAQRAVRQARRFAAEIVRLKPAVALRSDGAQTTVSLSDGTELSAAAVVIACGVAYRRLQAPGVDDLVGRGVYYGAAVTDAQDQHGAHVVVVGGANSAGQAALHFAQFARAVTVLVRGDSLAAAMSSYLVERVEASDNIEVRTGTEVVGASGSERLERIEVAGAGRAQVESLEAQSMYIFIGAVPHTDWLRDSVARDERGFVLTGRDLPRREPGQGERDALPLETSASGVFAAGDVRHGSVKRVASAVGEGSMAVQLVHQHRAAAALPPP